MEVFIILIAILAMFCTARANIIMGTVLNLPMGLPIISAARPQGAAWDIGACEYAAGTAAAPPAFDRQALPHATIRMRGASFSVTLPFLARSPELTIVDLAGRAVYHTALKKRNGTTYEGLWPDARVAGSYFAIVNERAREKAPVGVCSRFVLGK